MLATVGAERAGAHRRNYPGCAVVLPILVGAPVRVQSAVWGNRAAWQTQKAPTGSAFATGHRRFSSCWDAPGTGATHGSRRSIQISASGLSRKGASSSDPM